MTASSDLDGESTDADSNEASPAGTDGESDPTAPRDETDASLAVDGVPGTQKAELDPTISIEQPATEAEAAAISAAIGVHLGAQAQLQAAIAAQESTERWTGTRWQFAGRVDALEGRTPRVPDAAPTDEWTAVGRSDRF